MVILEHSSDNNFHSNAESLIYEYALDLTIEQKQLAMSCIDVFARCIKSGQFTVGETPVANVGINSDWTGQLNPLSVKLKERLNKPIR